MARGSAGAMPADKIDGERGNHRHTGRVVARYGKKAFI